MPKVISFGYTSYHESFNKRSATCRFCKTKVSDVCGTTSNFIRQAAPYTKESSSVCVQVEQYFDMCDDNEEEDLTSDCLRFWTARKQRFPILYRLAMRSLSAPASSAPIERVFSHGGIIMRPHRASLGDTTLSRLVFLKCNRLYGSAAQEI
jgi:hypothetical protein